MVVELEEARPDETLVRVEVPRESERARSVLIKVYRHRPADAADEPRKVTYRVPLTKGLTVLDALLWIKEHVDPGLSFRYSCRMGICGSCGMLINGRPALGCEAQVGALGTDVVEVAPLPNYPVVRDIATDFTDFFSHHRRIKPYLIRTADPEASDIARESLQTEEQKFDYYQFSMCIMCGLCDAACPIAGLDPEFLGPQALSQAYRFAADSRDEGWWERAEVVDAPHGCFRCELAGSCSAVCPKGIDPALAIQLLKREILRHRLARRRRARRSASRRGIARIGSASAEVDQESGTGP